MLFRHALSRTLRGTCGTTLTQHLTPLLCRHSSNLLLAVDKDDLTSTHIFETQLAPLKDNEVRLKVEKFASTYFGAKSVIIVSASSKTALGIAQRLSNKNKAIGNKSKRLHVIGVTSTTNAHFVASTLRVSMTRQ